MSEDKEAKPAPDNGSQAGEDPQLPKSFKVLPPVANPLIPRLVDLCVKVITDNFQQCSQLHLVPHVHRRRIVTNISLAHPLSHAVMTIPDGIYWKRLTNAQFPNIPHDPARKTWKRFFLEKYASKRLEEATSSTIDEVFNELRIVGPYIREIKLTRSPCKVSIFKLFRTFRALKKLSLVYGDPRRNFAAYEEFENFDVRAENSATLRDCQVICQDFKQLGANCSLQEFDMTDNSLDNPSFIKIAEGLYTSLINLTHLTFSHNQIGNDGAHAIASVMLRNPIKYLDLSDNKIGSEGTQKLCSCAEQCPMLETLNLSSNQIGNKGILFIGLLIERSTTLLNLDISGNRISHFGDVISGLRKNTTLKNLVISANPIDDEDYDTLLNLLNEEGNPLDTCDLRKYDLNDEDFLIKTTETSEAPLLRFK